MEKEIVGLYEKENCAYVEHFYAIGEWKKDIKFEDIKFIYFEFCDRGIACWKKFSDFLKNSFPNLEVLLLCQNYTYDDTHENIDSNTIAKKEISDFMNDDWLKYIWIQEEQHGHIKYFDFRKCHFRFLKERHDDINIEDFRLYNYKCSHSVECHCDYIHKISLKQGSFRFDNLFIKNKAKYIFNGEDIMDINK
jgi:hypothetical protein